ncbi:UPF0496 protein At3g28270 isoform X1 [Raphanus sativus]|uniref:UPF0496 protein At3g28270 isoform X1 n=2 Tax=Raphanus sativus TaxID=3726 RepID=A0A6J0K501_RAPSA|nr:UPF0496 protein At3g28270 isoform X1 [Raphanus sativus]
MTAWREQRETFTTDKKGVRRRHGRSRAGQTADPLSLSLFFSLFLLLISMALHEVYSGQISAYKAACEEHPELKAFDSSLQEKTKKVLNSIIAQAKTGSYSIITSYAEVYGYLLEAILDVAKFIIRIEGGVWENEDLRSLVKAYFEDTLKTLEFFKTVDNLVDKASIGDGYIQRAVELFDKESEDGGNNKKRYEKTLEELKKFEDMKEDFDGDKLKAQFDLVKKEQESLLEKVSKLKTKIDEAYAESMMLTLVTSVFLPCVFIGVALIEVAINAHNGEALVIGASLLLPFVILGYLPKLEDILKKQEEIAKQVEKGLEVNKDAMATIMSLVENLLEKISSMLEIADFAGEDSEIDTKLALQLINKKMSGFTDEINEVGENVAKLKELVTGAIIKVLEKIKG